MPKSTIPLLPLRDIVVFPHMVVPLFIGREKSLLALETAMAGDKKIFLATQIQAGIDNPREKDFSEVGTIGKVLQILRLPDGTVKAMAEGIVRARISQFEHGENYFKVKAILEKEIEIPKNEWEILSKIVMECVTEYSKLNKNISKGLVDSFLEISEPSQLSDTIAAHLPLKTEDKLNLLSISSVAVRFHTLIDIIKKEIDFFQVDQRVRGRVKDQMSKTQRNYYLNEQIRAIKKEIGAPSDQGDELKELEEKINNKKMTEEAKEKAEHEFKKLKMMSSMSAEATVIRNYIDWIISLPWFDVSEISADIEKAEKILDEDHYGLKKPKERILEYLAVQVLVKKVKGPILCLVGPPGVGKTSIAKSIARATGRKYLRLSLGGVRDESEIRGHRRTYIGAMPGKIIQSIKKAGVNNPVICLDEVDKMSMDFRGDPSAALLEVLDPEQNNNFNDHYLDLDYDLSDIFFITTANTMDIPLPLLDRMEIIRLPGYAEYEKYHIAKDFLLNKQIEANGLKDKKINFTKNSLLAIIQKYTREAGVRNLEREIAAICRKIAREVVSSNKSDTYNVTAKTVQKYLGPPRHKHGEAEKKDQIGLVTGLAWTKVGGELLNIEVLILQGKGELILTGQLGDVMKESAKAAVSYIRSRSNALLIDSTFHKKSDIHIHLPEGATPKDGPSAGISMCTAIVSAIIEKPVHKDLAMTGEITLRGHVLPIGGLKEKIFAAHRGGITRVIIPRENEKDLHDIPKTVLKHIKIIPVEHMDEVLPHAIVHDTAKPFFNKSYIPFQAMAENLPQPSSLL